MHNGEDDCCFRADLVKPYIYEQIKPFFKLFGDESALAWHENRDPGTHNYQLDNRQQAYAFFTQHFHLPVTPDEIVSDAEIRTAEQLTVPMPANNLTLAALAKQLGSQIQRAPNQSGSRAAQADYPPEAGDAGERLENGQLETLGSAHALLSFRL